MAVASDIQQQVYDLLSRASNLSFISAEQESGRPAFLVPGQQVAAEVLQALPNSRVQVRIGGDRYNLDLPMPVRVGQLLELTFVAAEPRSTFAIARPSTDIPPVSLSDASRLLSLLVTGEQMADPRLRASLHSIGDLLRNSTGEAAVLAHLLDEGAGYGRSSGAAASVGDRRDAPLPSAEQQRLEAFETAATGVLKNVARSSRSILVEAVNNPLSRLPFLPGEEVDVTVVGALSGGRTLIRLAGTTLELLLPHRVEAGDILRLTYIAAEPKPLFALQRNGQETGAPQLSESSRWLSVLEHSEGGVSPQQSYVLERLNSVLKSLPADSPAFTVISDDVRTYRNDARPGGRLPGYVEGAVPPTVSTGNGIILSDDMARLLQEVIKGNRIALLESAGAGNAGNFIPGQQLRGEIVNSLGGGRFSVQIAGQLLDFSMPKGVRRGDLVTLFFIEDEPRQTFLMVRFGRSGDSLVSDTGRWLSGFLEEAANRMAATKTLNLLETLLTGPPADAPQLGRALQQAFRESGLFYESHLSRWFGGDYPLDELLREPQGRLSRRLPQGEGVASQSAGDVVTPDVRTVSPETLEAAFKKAGSSISHEGIADQRTIPVVGEQLTALQNSQLVLRGNLFPGRALEWTVAERDARRDASGERERGWETAVSLVLPHLGAVKAQLTLEGMAVSVRVVVEDSASVAVLQQGKEKLVEQLAGAGLSATEMSIVHAAA